MQYFKDSAGKIYAYNDDINITNKTGDNGLFPNIPSGLTPYTPPAPTAAELLADAQAVQTGLVNQSYQQTIEADISYTNQAGNTDDFQADPASQQNIIRTLLAYTATKEVPTGFYWVSSTNAQIPFTFVDLQNLAQDMTNRGWIAFTKLQSLKTRILAATTVAAVQAIVW